MDTELEFDFLSSLHKRYSTLNFSNLEFWRQRQPTAVIFLCLYEKTIRAN